MLAVINEEKKTMNPAQYTASRILINYPFQAR